MRLIDADALLQEMKIGRKAAALLVQDAPTVEAEPAVHGRWIVDIEHLRATCSKCGKILRFSDKIQIAFLHDEERFCYYCGARMDLEADNG